MVDGYAGSAASGKYSMHSVATVVVDQGRMPCVSSATLGIVNNAACHAGGLDQQGFCTANHVGSRP